MLLSSCGLTHALAFCMTSKDTGIVLGSEVCSSSSSTCKPPPWEHRGHRDGRTGCSPEVAPSAPLGEQEDQQLHCQHPAATLLVQHWSRAGRHDCGTCGFVLPRAFPLLRSERAKQSCKPLSIAQHKEAGAVISRNLLPSSGCMENSSWTPSWASRQVAGTQPCSSDVLTNHQPGNKAAGGSAKDNHQPKITSLPTSPESGGLCPLCAAIQEAEGTLKGSTHSSKGESQLNDTQMYSSLPTVTKNGATQK